MRRIVFLLLISSLLLIPAFAQKEKISRASASSPPFQGDLILTGNDVTVIEGEFNIIGNIIVEQTAVLILRNARVNFVQTRDYEFNMTFRNPADGNPRLLVQDTVIATNGYDMNIDFYGDSSASINDLSATDHLYVRLHSDSYALVSSSEIWNLNLYDSSVLTASDSSISGIWSFDSASVVVSNCRLDTLKADGNSEVAALNSTVGIVMVSSTSVNYHVSGQEPGFVHSWSFRDNCSVASTPTSTAPKVTLQDNEVGGWGFSSWGNSSLLVLDSELFALQAGNSSSVYVYNSTITDALIGLESSRWQLHDARIENLGSYGNSKLWLVSTTSNTYGIYGQSEVYVSWYLDAHVTDSFDQDVPSADVAAYYENITMAYSNSTNASGSTRLTLLEKTITATGEYAVGNYLVEATYRNHFIETIMNMTENKQLTLKLQGLVIPELPGQSVAVPLYILASLLTVLICKRRRVCVPFQRALPAIQICRLASNSLDGIEEKASLVFNASSLGS